MSPLHRFALLFSLIAATAGGQSTGDLSSTPWGEPSKGSDDAIAAWAKEQFKVSQPSEPFKATPPSEANALREGVSGNQLGNPLRRAESGATLRGANQAIAGESSAAREAFTSPAPTQPKTTAPPNELPAPSTPPQRIELPTAEPIEAKPSPTSAAPPQGSRYASEPKPQLPLPFEPVEARPAPLPRIEQSTPSSSMRIATRDDRSGDFDTASWDHTNPSDGFSQTTSSEGGGQPGPAELEGPQSASLVIEKRGPREARVGQPCRFVVKVRNTGRQAAENVVLTDEVPAGARLVAAVPPADSQSGRVSWRLGTLAAGEERAVEMRLEPLREGPIGSVATVSFDASASATTRCTRPQLAIRASTAPRVRVGQKHVVRIELHNPGTGAATGVMLLDNLPDNVRHAAGPQLEYEVGTLAAGETRRIDLELSAERAGHVLNTLTAVADGELRAEHSIEFDVVAPSLSVGVQGPKRRYLERPASYTVSIDNPGSAPAKDVRLVTHLPRGMEFVRANNLGEYDEQTHAVYWSLAELPEGERGAVKVVALPIAAGEHTLRVEGQTSDGLRASESQNVLVEGIASLAFEVRDRQDPIEVGGTAEYDIRVKNEGTKAATNVRLRVEVPAGMQGVAAQGQTAHRLSEQLAEFAPMQRLEPGAEARYRVRLRGVQAGDQRVSVLVDSDDLDRPIRREESTRVFDDN